MAPVNAVTRSDSRRSRAMRTTPSGKYSPSVSSVSTSQKNPVAITRPAGRCASKAQPATRKVFQRWFHSRVAK